MMIRAWITVLVSMYFFDVSSQQLKPGDTAVVWIGKNLLGQCTVYGWLEPIKYLFSSGPRILYSFPFYADNYTAITVDSEQVKLYVHDIPVDTGSDFTGWGNISNFLSQANNESVIVMINAAKYLQYADTSLTTEQFYRLKKDFTEIYHPDTSLEVTGFDIHSESQLLYWSDATYRRICVYEMQEEMQKFKYWMPVITTNLVSPRDVVVYLSLLFWSDIGSNPKIEKSDLVGNNRVILVSPKTTTLVRPTTLCIDRTYNRLCWLDAGAGHVGCVEFDGSNIVTFTVTNINKATSFAILMDYFFFGFSNESKIRIANLTSTSLMKEITDHVFQNLSSVTDMAVLSVPTQLAAGPCLTNKGGCEQICFGVGASESTNVTCRCAAHDGFKLKADGKSCETDPRITEFLVVSDVGEQSISFVNIVMGNKTRVPQANGFKPSVIEYDRGGHVLYFVDISSNKIQKILLTNQIIPFDTGATSPITSLALDRRTGNLFYSFSTFISVLLGNSSKPLWPDKPNARLSIDNTYGILYFTTFQDAGTISTTIFWANIDSLTAANATPVATFLQTLPCHCTAMAIDFKTREMFLGDASGNLWTLQLDKRTYTYNTYPSGNFTGLTLDDDYVYLADINDTCLKKVNRMTKEMSCHTITSFNSPFSVVYPMNNTVPPTPPPLTTTPSVAVPPTPPPLTTTPSVAESVSTTIVIIIVVSIGGTVIIVAIIITCGCVVYKLKRKKMLEQSVENEYERNLPSGPVYDAIDGLDMGTFTLSRNGNSRENDQGELTEQMRGTQFGAPDGMSYNNTSYEQNLGSQNFGSQNFDSKRPSIEGSESGITNPRYVKMARSTLTPPDVGIYLRAT